MKQKTVSPVRIARKSSAVVAAFVASCDPFALDSVLGPPDVRDASGDKGDRVSAALDACSNRQRRKYGNQAGNPLTTLATAYNPE